MFHSAALTAGRPGRAEATGHVRTHPLQSPRVSGRIVTHNGRRLLAGAVMMANLGDLATAMSVRDVMIGADGTFLFRNVAPGRYTIRAQGDTDRQGILLYGAFDLTVSGEDADGLIIVLTPGAIVEGRLESEGPGQLRLDGGPSPRVRAVAADGIQFGSALSEPIQQNGRFRFRGLMPGEHVFRIEGLPGPWILRAVYLDEREITDVPLPLRPSQRVRNLRVVVTDVPQATAFEGAMHLPWR